jgi:hypothetical protein
VSNRSLTAFSPQLSPQRNVFLDAESPGEAEGQLVSVWFAIFFC